MLPCMACLEMQWVGMTLDLAQPRTPNVTSRMLSNACMFQLLEPGLFPIIRGVV